MEVVAHAAEEFGGEGARAHAGGIGLDHGHDPVEGVWRAAAAGRGLARDGVGRGDEGVGAVIDIEMGALGAFEEHVAACGHGILDDRGHVAEVGDQASGHRGDGFGHGHVVQGRHVVELGEKGIFFDKGLDDLATEQFGILEVTGPDADAGHFVFVARADAAAGGADLAAGAQGFPSAVDEPVVGHDDVGLAADDEPARRHVHAPCPQGIHLLAQHLGIEHHAVADEAGGAGVQDAGGEQVHDGFFAADHQGMAGVVAALEPDHGLGRFGQQVDDLAFAFIAPLGAVYDDALAHALGLRAAEFAHAYDSPPSLGRKASTLPRCACSVVGGPVGAGVTVGAMSGSGASACPGWRPFAQ